jgi:hypothetical protein
MNRENNTARIREKNIPWIRENNTPYTITKGRGCPVRLRRRQPLFHFN